MDLEEAQIRVTFGKGLIGYRGKLHGDRGMAIINKGPENHMIGWIRADDLNKGLNEGPCYDFDKEFNIDL